MTPTLKAGFWTSALIRRAETAGAFAAVVRQGDKDAGACLVKVRLLDGQAALYRPIRNMAGERVWLPKGPENEAEIDLYINNRVDDDPDIWVIEIEDRKGRHFLTEPIDA
ncbi:DUF1491 family protein [Hellea balneolensis]|uniref:DUF1491 family protein n=1 Tax=Hellea balneolensis TaxID=287478 RepID=UPI0003F4AD2A|nr:DUF1491 family protein [Hellea balneolensis]